MSQWAERQQQGLTASQEWQEASQHRRSGRRLHSIAVRSNSYSTTEYDEKEEEEEDVAMEEPLLYFK